MSDEEIEQILRGLEYPANTIGDMVASARRLEDGYVEITLTDDEGNEQSADVRFAGKFNGSSMLEVRLVGVEGSDVRSETKTIYVSAVGYALFGVIYCEV